MLDGSRRGDSKGDAISFNCILGKNMLTLRVRGKGKLQSWSFMWETMTSKVIFAGAVDQ